MEEQVLVTFQALKDEAASFARSLARTAGCENNLVAYSKVTPLSQFLKLLKERFADPARGIRASDKLQTIHSRQWRSAKALKSTMDDFVAVPDHGVTETQLVKLFYRAIPEALRGHFFDKSQQADITYDQLSREVVLYESKSLPVTTFWHKDLEKEKKWKNRTISGQVKAKDHMILTLEEGGTDEVPYDQIEWGLEDDGSSVGQGRSYAAVAAGERPQGRAGGQGQRGQAMGGRGPGAQGVGGQENRQAGGRGQEQDGASETSDGGVVAPIKEKTRGTENQKPSFEKVVPVTLAESSLPELCHLYSELRCRGRPPVVVDVDLIPKDPEGALRTLCTALDIPFQSSMIRQRRRPSTTKLGKLNCAGSEATPLPTPRDTVALPATSSTSGEHAYVASLQGSYEDYAVRLVLPLDQPLHMQQSYACATSSPSPSEPASSPTLFGDLSIWSLTPENFQWMHLTPSCSLPKPHCNALMEEVRNYLHAVVPTSVMEDGEAVVELCEYIAKIDREYATQRFEELDPLTFTDFQWMPVPPTGRFLKPHCNVLMAQLRDYLHTAVPTPLMDAGVEVVDLHTYIAKIDREFKTQRYDDIDAPLLYVRIQIGEATCNALIDCGASRNYISQDFMVRADLGPLVRRKPQPTQVTLADGHMHKSFDRCIDDVPVYFAPHASEAVSFDILDTKFDMILGMSSLRSEDHLVNLYHRTVHIRDRNGVLVPCTVPLPHPSINCHVVSATSMRASIIRDDIEEMGECFPHALPPHDASSTDSSSDPRITELLNAYSDVFEGPHGLVPERPICHEIILEDGVEPPRDCIYRMSEEELSVLRAQLDDLLEKGWIRPSASPYGAPVLFVRKKNKDLRLCIDYRKLNAQTIRNADPLPRIDDLLERLGGAKFFSKLDLKSGYHQLEIRLEDRYKTARYGHFKWLVMPVGLTNAPATFQAAMTTEFRHMLDRYVLIYLDDILVYSRSLDEHVEHLRTVLERLRQAKYKANRDKCEFARQELEYLGHYVTPQGIRPLADKIEALQLWPEPTNTTDVRSFMGLAGYYQRFITGYSRIAAPMTRLQLPKMPFVFDDDACRSFQALKTAMLMTPVLSIYDPTLPTRVTTDASGYGIGAVLEQHDDDDWHPMEYFSHRVPPINSLDDARKKELLAFVMALKRWRHFLLGRRRFTWVTGNNPLTYYKTQDTVSSTIGRWMYFIDQFDFTPKHLPGLSNHAADALSRRPDLHQGLRLNAQTIKNVGPRLHIDDLHERLGGAKYFSKLDLKAGYHHLEIHPKDRYKNTFKTRYRHLEWVVMPFGLTNAPTIFQAAMTTEFHDMLDRFVLIYLDDILVYSQTLDEHIVHLCAVLDRLCMAMYKANRAKCEFAQQELKYLGHFVTPQGIRTLADKVKAIQDWLETTNTMEVHFFMGLIRYYQRFIGGYARIAAPLSRLQSPKVPFLFTDEVRSSFHKLTTVLLLIPLLSIYYPTLPTRVTTNASGYDMSAVLEQHDGVDWHPVEYFSQKVPPINSVDDVRKELLAFVTVLKRWRHFLLGHRRSPRRSLHLNKTSRALPKWFGPCTVISAADDEPDDPSFVIDIPLHLPIHLVFHASKLATYTPAKSDDFPSRRSQDPPSVDGHQEVDHVITHCKHDNKPMQYKVTFKWRNPNDTEWISRAALQASAPLIHARYEKKPLATEAATPAPDFGPPSNRQLHPRRLEVTCVDKNLVANFEGMVDARAVNTSGHASLGVSNSLESLAKKRIHLLYPVIEGRAFGVGMDLDGEGQMGHEDGIPSHSSRETCQWQVK
ncbi:hypothetical protein CBR_g26141 [Chara braunii]|uniref:Reverse transcriptase domain-containing protein n=1 Tax=Chara braunii TaxID=69332 RepID=A0A388JW27_CHABU|nr:hypothetical protein CBR_g26141 [Chara braunii]|eukprot:GBG61978.1 hypothetical protein CBR_g26141 [Chara braunii]